MSEFIAEGRIVWGHPGKAQIKKDVRTKQPKLNDQGQQIQQWVFGLAVPKQNFFAKCLPAMQQEASQAFPHGVPQNFSWKYKDGDGRDANGKPFADREGYAGHCVMTISTEAFAPQLFKFENGAYRQMAPEEIKCGDYVAVKITCKFNGAHSPNTPGLYINPNGIIFLGYGQEIVSSGQDPEEMFAGYTPQLPVGASATPVMSNAPMPGAMMPATGQPAYGAPAGQPAYAPQPAYSQPPAQPAQMPASGGYAPPVNAGQPAYGQPPAQPAQMPPPAYDFVQNAGQPSAGQPAYGAPAGQPAYAPQPAYGQPPAGQPAQGGYGAPVNGIPGIPQGR